MLGKVGRKVSPLRLADLPDKKTKKAAQEVKHFFTEPAVASWSKFLYDSLSMSKSVGVRATQKHSLQIELSDHIYKSRMKKVEKLFGPRSHEGPKFEKDLQVVHASHHIFDKMGQGAFGRVYKCLELETSQLRALKVSPTTSSLLLRQKVLKPKLKPCYSSF